MSDANSVSWKPSIFPGLPIQDALGPKRTHLGLLTQHKGSPQLLTELKVRLQLLALGSETEPALAEVDAALSCKLGGTAGAAVRTLVCWGGLESEERLKRLGSDLWWRHRAVRDQFERWAILFGVELYPPLFRALPRAEAQELLVWVLRASRGQARTRLALTVIDRRRWRDRGEVLKILAAGDDTAAQFARTALLEERASGPSAMSAAEFRVAFRVVGLSSYLQAALGTSKLTIQLWASGELRVPARAAEWLRAQVEKAFGRIAWRALPLQERDSLERQLRHELSPMHLLAGRNLTALAQALGSDDAAFFADDGTIALVHLTYGLLDPEGRWPTTIIFPNTYALLQYLACGKIG